MSMTLLTPLQATQRNCVTWSPATQSSAERAGNRVNRSELGRGLPHHDRPGAHQCATRARSYKHPPDIRISQHLLRLVNGVHQH